MTVAPRAPCNRTGGQPPVAHGPNAAALVDPDLRRAAVADDAGRNGRARLGRRRCGLRHRRRLRRSPQLRDGDPRTSAGGGRLPRRHPQPARLALLRAVAAIRPAATVLRHLGRQHGLADQPLHRQQEGAQRRRLFAGRPHRPAPRPGDAAVLPSGAGGVPRRADHRWRRRGVAAPAGPLRLLERYGPPLDPARLQGRPSRLRHGRGKHRGNCPAPGGGADGARPARPARRGVRAGGEGIRITRPKQPG